MTNQPHATRADIEAILNARREASIESIPTLPQAATPDRAAPPRQPGNSSLPGTPITEPVTRTDAQAAPPPQVGDAEVEAFLNTHLPALISAAQDLAQPPFAWAEVLRLGEVVSRAVAMGLPQVRDLEARALVVVIVRHVWRAYGAPLLPASARPLAGVLEAVIIAGLEAAYRLAVKSRN